MRRRRDRGIGSALGPALLLASVAVAASPSAAMRREPSSPLAAYVRARAADVAGDSEAAAAGYAALLAADPGDQVLALRAYRQAMAAGDRTLALRAARTLDAKGVLPPDGRLLLLTQAVEARDWKGAAAMVDRMAGDQAYAFAMPTLRAWIAFGAGRDPVPELDKARTAGMLAATYAAEPRAYLLLATGRTADGLVVVRALATPANPRAVRIRLAAAAILARKDKAAARALLDGDDAALGIARARLDAGKPLPAAVDDPASGLAELLVRVAVDINREKVTPLSITFARLATFAAPNNAETWLAAGELLGAAGQADAGLAALAQVRADDPLMPAARDARLRLLVRKGDRDAALREALAAANARDAGIPDWTRVGDLYSDLKRPSDAAAAYAHALAMAGDDPRRRASILLLRGGALDQAGDWAAAKKDLQEAVRLTPDQPIALNYLGYAQLERRENLGEAEKLIEAASKLKPDDSAITDSLGWTYYLRGNIASAVPTLERAAAADAGEPTINEHLGDAYWTAGRRYEARYAWRAALVYADAADASRLRSKIDGGLTPATAAK